MASPTFFGNGNTPTESDAEWQILQRILGALNDIIIANGGNTMAEPIFLSRGMTPTESDTKWKILQRILAAVRNLPGGGATAQGQIFSGHYGGGTPTDTPTTTSAIAYDLDSPFNQWLWNGVAWI